MIIEFFGLSNTGKFVLFIKHLILNPLNSLYLFKKLNSNRIQINFSPGKKSLIRKMRNSYLAGVFAKYEYLKNKKDNIFTDEFSLQSLFMILQEKSNEKEIR